MYELDGAQIGNLKAKGKGTKEVEREGEKKDIASGEMREEGKKDG